MTIKISNEFFFVITIQYNMTGPAKIGHVGTLNLPAFSNFYDSYLFMPLCYGHIFLTLIKQFIDFITTVTECRYSISTLRYVLLCDGV